MKLGMKVSLDRDSAADIIATRPAMIEVWFNVIKKDDYNALFCFVKHQPMDVGLHYWGALPNGLLTNIAIPDPAIVKPSLALMKATIDIAARNHFAYVNVHTDMRVLVNVNFTTMKVSVASEPADINICTRTFTENITLLKKYADKRGVLLTIETIPQRDTTSWSVNRTRTGVIDLKQLPITVQLELGSHGFAIANDFCHTACNMISDDRDVVWRFLYKTTRTLAPATRLIHLGFTVIPYNGVDFHDSLDNPVLETIDAIPNNKQMIELLTLFPNRDDVWILVEPKTDHVKNYFLARGILEKAGVLTEKR
jgi:hypothetical protein